MRDAQNRVGQGTIELDAQGVPRAPAGVTPVSAGRDSVKLSVSLSGESSHPAVTGVELVAGGSKVGRCSLDGGQASCTVTGLTPGERRTYTARAINSVGSSEPSANGAETWAYRPPAPPTLESPTAVSWENNTDPGKARVKITIGSSTAANRILTVNGVETPIAADGIYEVAAGHVTASVISVDDASMLPPGYTGSDGGKGDANSGSGTAHGAPSTGSAALMLSGDDRTDWSLSTPGFSGSGDALTYHYSVDTQSGAATSSPITGSGLPKHKKINGSVWASNRYGKTGTVSFPEVTTGKELPRIDGKYDVNVTPSNNGNWSITYAAGTPTYTPAPEGIVTVITGVSPGSPTGAVRQCAPGNINCSDNGTITPSGLHPLTLTLDSCVPWDGATLPGHAEISDHFAAPIGTPGAGYTFTAHTDRRITVAWDDSGRGAGTFTAGLCEATPPDEDDEP